MIKGKKYARRCDVTGKGMNSGYCFGDGEYYCKYAKDALVYCKKHGFNSMEKAYDADFGYYTDWEDEDDFQYQMVNGELVEIDE